MANVIVVGAGIGGVPAAYELRRKLDRQHVVTLVGASPYSEFTPSNPWVAVGWRRIEQTRVALQEPLQDKGVQWVAERVEHIDADARRLRLTSGRELDYDYLVIATGPKLGDTERSRKRAGGEPNDGLR